MDYRAIVFDLGGVLLDSEEAHASAARVAARRFNLAIPAGDWPRIRGASYENFFARFLTANAAAEPGGDTSRVVAFAYDLYFEELRRSARLFPHVIDLLSLARKTFEYVAVATSMEWRLADHALRVAQLTSYFDCVMSGDHVTQKKPDPEIFLVLAWLLGIKPSRMVVVEDSSHGIRAGRLARAHVVKIATIEGEAAQLGAVAHRSVSGHIELLSYIRDLSSSSSKRHG